MNPTFAALLILTFLVSLSSSLSSSNPSFHHSKFSSSSSSLSSSFSSSSSFSFSSSYTELVQPRSSSVVLGTLHYEVHRGSTVVIPLKDIQLLIEAHDNTPNNQNDDNRLSDNNNANSSKDLHNNTNNFAKYSMNTIQNKNNNSKKKINKNNNNKINKKQINKTNNKKENGWHKTPHKTTSKTAEGLECIVETVEEDECLRVGEIYPKEFSCGAEQIEYQHSGNLYKKKETVIFKIYKTHPYHHHYGSLVVVFRITKSKEEIFIHKDPQKSLNESLFSYRDVKLDPSNESFCVVEMLQENFSIVNPIYANLLPDYQRVLRFTDENGKKSVIFECQLFPKIYLKVENDSFGVSFRGFLMKNGGSNKEIIERDFIKIDSKHQNEIKSLVLSLAHAPSIHVKSGSNVLFPHKILKLPDSSKILSSVVLVTKSDPTIFFSSVNAQTKIIKAFKYEDLIRNQILLNCEYVDLNQSRKVEVEIKAVDFYFQHSPPILLRVIIMPNQQQIILKDVTIEHYKPGNIFKCLSEEFKNDQNAHFKLSSSVKHGDLIIKGLQKNQDIFTMKDVLEDNLAYIHTNPQHFEDEILVKLIFSRKSYLCKILIKALNPLNLQKPIVTHQKKIIFEKNSNKMSVSHFNAEISHVQDDKIKFELKMSLVHGTLKLKYNRLFKGITVQSFTKFHLKHGFLHYDLNEKPLNEARENITLVVKSPFSKFSKTFSFEIVIKKTDSSNDKNFLALLSDEKKPQLEAKDNSLIPITSNVLCYSINHNPTYVITQFAYSKNSKNLGNFGKIVMKKSNGIKNKFLLGILLFDPSKSIIEIDSFTQEMINQTSIYFMPTQAAYIDDNIIENLKEKIVFLNYAVTYNDKIYHNQLSIKIPRRNLITNVFLQIGMTKTLNENFKSLNLPPSTIFKLVSTPKFGVLAMGKMVMELGGSWSFTQLSSQSVWYQHNCKSCSKDVIIFDVGEINFETHIYSVSSITHHTFNLPLKWNIGDQMKRSEVENGKTKDYEELNDVVKNSNIISNPKHIHLEGEHSFLYSDSYKLIESQGVLRENFVLQTNTSHDKCHFTIKNISINFKSLSSLKLLVKQDLKSDGVKNAFIDYEIMQLKDDDESSEDVIFKIYQSPAWGRILNLKTREKIKYFTDNDLKNRNIFYELGNVRPKKGLFNIDDSVLIYATKGLRTSKINKINIKIKISKSSIKRRYSRNSLKHHKITNRNKKRYINRHYTPRKKHLRRSFNSDRRKINFGMKVRDIQVRRGGKHKFIVTFKKPSKKRRSMSETRLILEKPPSHGKVIVLNDHFYKEKHYMKDPYSKSDNFNDINLVEISNKVPMIYEHDGSKSSYDEFILALSNEVKTIKQGVSVKIASVDKVDLKEYQITTSPILLHKDHPIAISSKHLTVKDTDIEPINIEFELVKLPSHGYLKVLNQNIRVASHEQVRLHETFTLEDIINNKVLFVPLSTAIKNDSFEVQINADIPIIKITILSSIVDPSFHSFVVKTKNISSACLNGELYQQLELNDLPSCTVISLTKIPSYGRLSKTIYSGKEFIENEICYKGISQKSFPDHYELNAKDCNNITRSVVKVEVIHENAIEDDSLKLITNVPLMVMHGNTAFLSKTNLFTSQKTKDPEQIKYIVIDQPKHGVLILKDSPSNTFTQNDINENLVAYKSNRIDESMMDYFLFNVETEAGSEIKAMFFSILIQPAVKLSPKTIINPSNTEIYTTEGINWLPFNSSHLKTINIEAPNEKIIYQIKTRPKHVFIENFHTSRIIKHRFTQEDLDKNFLRFVLKGKLRKYNDSLVFKVNHLNRTVLDNLIMTLEWSSIEFQKTFFKLCSSNSVINVPITRFGNLEQSCQARINVVPNSAVEHVDYFKISKEDVSFNEGQMKKDWALKMLDSGRFQQPRLLSITLSNATHSIIGFKNRVFIEIIDKTDEYCARRKTRKSSLGSHADFPRSEGNYNSPYLEANMDFYEQGRRSIGNHLIQSDIPKPCIPSTKSLLFFHQERSQLYMCDGKDWVEWNNHLESPQKNLKTCPLGWELYGDNCFLASKTRHSWLRSEKMCRRDGGHLTFVASKEHLHWLSTLTHASEFWIGLNNRRKLSSWQSVGHTQTTNYVTWAVTQPCTYCTRNRCAQVNKNLEYEKKHCTRSYQRFVCVKAARLLRTSRKAVRRRKNGYSRRYMGS